MLERLLEVDGRKQGHDAHKGRDYHYLAPECVESSEFKRSKRFPYAHDIWALGVILYEKIAGHKPFAGATAEEYLANVTNPDVAHIDIPETCSRSE